MTLKAVVEKLDDVPEAIRGEYTEKDGKFYLDLDDSLSTHVSILPLANTLKNVKAEKQALRTKIGELETRISGLPEDFDLDKYTSDLQELESLRAGNKDPAVEQRLQGLRAQLEGQIRSIKDDAAAQLAAKDLVIAGRDSQLAKIFREDRLRAALVAVGANKGLLDGALAMLLPSVKTRTLDDGSVQTFVETDLGEVDVAKFVDSWSKSESGKPYITPASGSGANGGGNGGGHISDVNPWHKDTWNLTKQGLVLREDRTKARRMMQEAKVPESNIRAVLGG